MYIFFGYYFTFYIYDTELKKLLILMSFFVFSTSLCRLGSLLNLLDSTAVEF